MALYLAVLRFRSPPWAALYKVPNVLESSYIPFDGPLSFADYYIKNLQVLADWRGKYLKDTLTTTIKAMSFDLKASYLLPAQQATPSMLYFWTPYDTRCSVQLQDTQASLIAVDQAPLAQTSLSLKINKRNDLERVFSWRELADQNLARDRQRRIKDRGDIEGSKGPYKNVALNVEIRKSHLLWVSIIEAGNKALLDEALRLLKQFGIGKKRHAGWGDLQESILYDFQSPRPGLPSLDHRNLIYTVGQHTYLETLRPMANDEVSRIIQSGYLPLNIKFTQGADQPPYWRKDTVVEYAKLLRRV